MPTVNNCSEEKFLESNVPGVVIEGSRILSTPPVAVVPEQEANQQTAAEHVNYSSDFEPSENVQTSQKILPDLVDYSSSVSLSICKMNSNEDSSHLQVVDTDRPKSEVRIKTTLLCQTVKL